MIRHREEVHLAEGAGLTRLVGYIVSESTSGTALSRRQIKMQNLSLGQFHHEVIKVIVGGDTRETGDILNVSAFNAAVYR